MHSQLLRSFIKCALFSLCLLSTSTYAFTFPSWPGPTNVRPLFTIGAGTASSSDLGNSTRFPIHNPSTDESYAYSANHATQTSGLGELFIGAEWQWQANLALQAGIDYNQAAPFSINGTLFQGVDAPSSNTYSYNYAVLTRQLLLQGKLLYNVRQIYHPYFLLGVGASFNKADHYSTSIPPQLSFTRLYSNNDTSSFSYALGLGIEADVSHNIRLGIGYRFTDLGRVQLGNATIDTTKVSGTLSQSHLYANEVLAQFTWLFC